MNNIKKLNLNEIALVSGGKSPKKPAAPAVDPGVSVTSYLTAGNAAFGALLIGGACLLYAGPVFAAYPVLNAFAPYLGMVGFGSGALHYGPEKIASICSSLSMAKFGGSLAFSAIKWAAHFLGY